MCLISRIWNANISRALIFAIFQKILNLRHLISREMTTDRLTKQFLAEYVTEIEATSKNRLIIDKFKEFVYWTLQRTRPKWKF